MLFHSSNVKTHPAKIALLLMLSMATCLNTTPVYADDLFNNTDNNLDWFNERAPGPCSTNVSTPVGNLPSAVPEPYNGVFTAAAQATNADPIIMASIFYIEHRGFPSPPPPYGNGPPWASSPAGASGPFQFIPGTWASYGKDGNVQDLKDAAAGAGRFIVALGGTNGIPLGNVSDPSKKGTAINVFASYNAGPAGNFGNKETQQYIRIGEAIYTKLKTGGNTTTPPPDNGGITPVSNTSSCSGGAISVSGPLTSRVVQIAKHELGHVGWSPYAPVSEEWCADFISWVFREAGSSFTGGDSGGWRYASVANLRGWFQDPKNGGSWSSRDSAKPQPGDVVTYTGDSHTNIVVDAKYAGDKLVSLIVIGGNQVTDNKDTSKVSQVIINVGDGQWSQIVGFGRKAEVIKV